ncbi:unnamed protein product, partial [Brenthis ino]
MFEARAQLNAARWTDYRRARYLRSPVPSPLPGTGWLSKTKRSTKDVPRMYATDRLYEGSRGCSGTLSDYTTPDSRAENRTPGDLRLRPPDNVTVGHCSIVFLVK